MTISTAEDAQLTTSYINMAKAQAREKHGTFGVICPIALTAQRSQGIHNEHEKINGDLQQRHVKGLNDTRLHIISRFH